MRARLTIAALGAALLLGGCVNPYDGQVDYGRSALLGAGVGAAAGLAAGAIADRPRQDYGYGGGYYAQPAPRYYAPPPRYAYAPPPRYGYGPPRGYYRGW
jgi:hypothetical protein